MRRVRALDALAVCVASALCAVACNNWMVAVISAAIALLSLASRDGARSDPFAQTAASLVCGALPAYLATNVLERTPAFGILEPVPGAVAVALLCAAAIRPVFSLSRAGGIANSALLLCALVALGQSKIHGTYIVLCALAAVLSLSARALERRPAHSGAAVGRRDLRGLAAMLVICSAVTALGGWSLPLAHRWSVQRYFDRYARAHSEAGLSDHMTLTAMDGVFQSDTVVLRVRGRRTDYLRGVAFDRYRLGGWSYSGSGARRTIHLEQRARGLQDGETEVRSIGGPTGWTLLPLDAQHITASDAAFEALPSGVLRGSSDGNTLWFRSGTPGDVTISAPTATDREVPRPLRALLATTITQWGCDRGEDVERVRCLEARLKRDYRYALSVPESRRIEPIAAFLTQHHRGHCEYFASALALLSRAAGVPARVVAGYRVSERSEWGDYYVVRERNAHSWVEAHVGAAGWTRFDATPASADELMVHHRVPRWRTWIESIRWAVVDLFDRVRARGALQWAIALLGLGLGASVLRRTLRDRRQRDAIDASSLPTAAMAALFAQLDRVGLRKSRGETLESFARRVGAAALGDGLAEEVSGALVAYAHARYGTDDAAALDAVDARLLSLARRIRKTS